MSPVHASMTAKCQQFLSMTRHRICLAAYICQEPLMHLHRIGLLRHLLPNALLQIFHIGRDGHLQSPSLCLRAS